MAKKPKDTEELEDENMPKEVPAAFNTAREGAMEAILAKRQEELAEEGVDLPEPEIEAKSGPNPPADGSEQLPEPDLEQPIPDTEPATLPDGITMEDGQMYATVVVDGQQVVKPIKDVMSGYQMVAASNARFAEAAAEKKEAEEWVDKMRREIDARASEPDMNAVMAQRAKLQAEADEAFMESDTELTSQKRQELFNLDREIFQHDHQPAAQQPQVDVGAQVREAIRAERETNAAEDREVAIESGWNWMKTNHPDIMLIEGGDYKNEDLNDMWQRKVEREEQAHPNSSPQEIFELAANAAKKALGIARPRAARRGNLPVEPVSGSPSDPKMKGANRTEGTITDEELEGVRAKAIKKMMNRGQPQAR